MKAGVPDAFRATPFTNFESLSQNAAGFRGTVEGSIVRVRMGLASIE